MNTHSLHSKSLENETFSAFFVSTIIIFIKRLVFLCMLMLVSMY